MTAKLLLIALLIIQGLVSPLGATGNATSTEAATIQSTENQITEIAYESPREAVRSFMNAMQEVERGNTSAIDKAFAAMHLAELPAESKHVLSAEMAHHLYKLLNSFTFSIDAIPETHDSRTYSLPVGKDMNISIVLYKYDDGFWKFNHSRTLNNLERYLEEIKKNQKAQESDSSIDPKLSSPRATMREFLDAMDRARADGYQDAIDTFDMSRVERALRREIGRERVAMLRFIMDRYKIVDLVEVPNDPQGPPYIFLTHSAGRVILEKVKNPDSNIESWKFSAQTVESLPDLYDAFRMKSVVAGVQTKVDIPMSVRLRDYMQANFPSMLRQSLLLENWQWLGIFCVIFLGLGVSKIVIYFLRKAIALIFKRENLHIDLNAENRFMKPLSYALVGGVWWLGLELLALPSTARLALVLSVKTLTTITGIWALYRLMDVIGNYLMGKALKTSNKFDDLLVPLVTRSLKTLSIAIGLIFLADLFALDVNKILAGLGIGGLAFALAAKDTISNIFGSLTILIDRPFQIGDWVTIGDIDGTVESVGVRSTRIRTFRNSLVTVPNSQLINASIDNWGARKYRRITCTVNIAYDTPPERIDSFCEGIRELLRIHPYSRKDFFIVNLTEFGINSLGIMVYCFVKVPDWTTEIREKHRLFNDIIRLARKIGVEFALQTQTVYLRNDERQIHENVPTNELEAFNEGKSNASQIVYDALGNPVKIPPPVSF